MATPEGLCTKCSATVVCAEHATIKPYRQSCWAGVHKWGTWTFGAKNGGVGHWRICKRCGLEQTK